jgi:hypothetical protein
LGKWKDQLVKVSRPGEKNWGDLGVCTEAKKAKGKC